MWTYFHALFEFFVMGSVSACVSALSVHWTKKMGLWADGMGGLGVLIPMMVIAIGVFLIVGGFVNWLFFHD